MSTSIEWTDVVWNPVVGCSRVSAGCEHCYAERVAHRGMSAQHRGLTVMGRHGPRWTGEVRFLPARLCEPLSWRRPRRVFVNSMSDLFHPAVMNEEIAAVFGIMAAMPEHTFQILTKRPERIADWFLWYEGTSGAGASAFAASHAAEEAIARANPLLAGGLPSLWRARARKDWPLWNVDIGVSVEDQRTADERIPVLLAAREHIGRALWVSYEPALGPIDFTQLDFLPPMRDPSPHDPVVRLDALRGHVIGPDEMLSARLDWIVIGGESGPGARPFDLGWARSTIRQAQAAGVPVFVKQLGACAEDAPNGLAGAALRVPREAAPLVSRRLVDRKGGDPSEWPEDLRVREWPEVERHA